MGLRVAGRRWLEEGCQDCGEPSSNHGLGRCRPCYGADYRRRHGIGNRTWRCEDLVSEIEFLARQGVPWADLPAKLRMTWDGIMLAHRRADQQIPERYRFRTGDLR